MRKRWKTAWRLARLNRRAKYDPVGVGHPLYDVAQSCLLDRWERCHALDLHLWRAYLIARTVESGLAWSAFKAGRLRSRAWSAYARARRDLPGHPRPLEHAANLLRRWLRAGVA